MTQQDPLFSILQNALSGDMVLRNKAEEDISKMAQDNFSYFILNISEKLSNEQVPKEIRQISSTLIKNMISHQNYKDKWINLPQELKQRIKENVLSTLASSDNDIRKAAGIAIAGMCRVELPMKQWTDIFDILVSTVTHENLFIQLSSVTTLGFIFQEISVEDISNEHVAKILNSFYTVLNKEDCAVDLHKMTLEAMMNFLPFISDFVKVEDQKKLLFDLIKKYTTHSDATVRKLALQIFLDLVRHYYDYFVTYIDTLIEFTTFLMEKDTNENIVFCFEIWGSIGDIEVSRIKSNSQCNYFCERASEKLMPLIFTNLVTNDYYNDSWTTSKAARFLVSIMSQCCQISFIEKVKIFIGQNIQSENPDLKHAALVAFGSILETTFHDSLAETANQSLYLITGFLNNQNEPDHIKEISSWVLQRITEYYGKELAKDEKVFGSLLKVMIEMLASQKKQVLCSICKSIHFLVKSTSSEGQIPSTGILTPHVSEVLNGLITLALANGSFDHDHNVALHAFLAVGTVVENAPTNTNYLLQGYFNNLVNVFETTLQPEKFPNDEMRLCYQDYLASVLSSFLIRAEIEEPEVKRLFVLVIDSFNKRKQIYGEGIMAIGSMAVCLEGKFEEFLPTFNCYLIEGLKMTNSVEMCQTSIHTTSDVIRGLGSKFSKYLRDYVPLVINILSSPEIDKNLKPNAFNIISDLYYSCKNDVFPYFNDTMGLIGTASQAAATLVSKAEDPETFEYLQDLKEHILETITCIFNAITEKEIHKEKDFIPYVSPIMQFVNKINSDEYHPSPEIMRQSLGIIGDFCHIYKGEMKQLIQTDVLEKIISRLGPTTTDKNTKSLIQFTQKKVSETMNSH